MSMRNYKYEVLLDIIIGSWDNVKEYMLYEKWRIDQNYTCLPDDIRLISPAFAMMSPHSVGYGNIWQTHARGELTYNEYTVRATAFPAPVKSNLYSERLLRR